MKPKDNLPVETLRAALDYDPATGRLFYKHRPESDFDTPRLARWWNTRNGGREAFTQTNFAGYKHGSIHQHRFLAHRVAWAIYHGEWPKDQIDHINGDPADNRIENLRVVPQFINCRNKRLRKDNATGHPGIVWLKRVKQWQASIPDGKGRHVYLGIFRTLDEAVAARDAATANMGFGPQHGRADA